LNVGGTLTGEYDGLDEGHKVGSFSGTNLYITYAGGDGNDVTLFSRAVPEPTTLLLALFGLALLPRRRRRSGQVSLNVSLNARRLLNQRPTSTTRSHAHLFF
jgi:hypothetical protein